MTEATETILENRGYFWWDGEKTPMGFWCKIAEFSRVHWFFGDLRTSDEQAEQHGRVVCRAAL